MPCNDKCEILLIATYVAMQGMIHNKYMILYTIKKQLATDAIIYSKLCFMYFPCCNVIQGHSAPHLSHTLHINLCTTQLFPTIVLVTLAFGQTAELARVFKHVRDQWAAANFIRQHLGGSTVAKHSMTLKSNQTIRLNALLSTENTKLK